MRRTLLIYMARNFDEFVAHTDIKGLCSFHICSRTCMNAEKTPACVSGYLHVSVRYMLCRQPVSMGPFTAKTLATETGHWASRHQHRPPLLSLFKSISDFPTSQSRSPGFTPGWWEDLRAGPFPAAPDSHNRQPEKRNSPPTAIYAAIFASIFPALSLHLLTARKQWVELSHNHVH